MESTIVYVAFGLILAVPVVRHLGATRRKEAAALAAARRVDPEAARPRGQHPHIDVSHCIGCGACTDACPEGDVLAVVAGKAAIVHGEKCIGHGLCAEACPVGAIEIVLAGPSVGADLPRLTPQHETSIPNLFVAGELGGLALIKNAVNQGRDCIDTIAQRLGADRRRAAESGVHDVCVVGAGPAGLSASLRAVERGLSYVTLEQGDFGGTVAHYPRRKLVLTSPVELPLYGRFRKLEISKENLLDLWRELAQRYRLRINTSEGVEAVRRDPDGRFTVTTPRARYRARAVVLALGRRGTPRKLGVPGEELPKVMYSLLDAEAYTGAKILVVGGGDSAVEAAMGLAYQRGNEVTLSYRREGFSRIKERNVKRMEECVRSGRLRVLFNSHPVEIRERSVVLEVGGQRRELGNDCVWVFAGGTPPNAFLEKIGVQTGATDLTEEAAREGRAAVA
ncbi:MAG TPA: NAD(P)-binding domain-containing protein [Gemmatimonadales bacterium]|nr:NAD(P)-binding domain-containing protein [Gemmatimonadales bacterium]